jgi:hypothetical protein
VKKTQIRKPKRGQRVRPVAPTSRQAGLDLRVGLTLTEVLVQPPHQAKEKARPALDPRVQAGVSGGESRVKVRRRWSTSLLGLTPTPWRTTQHARGPARGGDDRSTSHGRQMKVEAATVAVVEETK